MKKYTVLLLAFLLSGCAWMNPFNWWGEPEVKEEVKTTFEPNKFLWQAARDKVAFMKEISEDKESGTITTGWTLVEGVFGVEYQLEIKVLSENLRSDCLVAKVNKRLWNGQEWVAEPDNLELDRKVEDAILKQARVLYRKSLNLK